MTRARIPVRHWRSYGNDPLPTGIEARDEPFAAFPSWFLRIECDRCGKVQMINEVHFARPNMPIRAILAKTRHDGCGGRAGKAELLTGIEGVSSRPVRRIVLQGG
jgi:ribosomal protein S27E